MPRDYDDVIDTIQYGVLHIGSNTANQDFRITTTSQRICSNEVCEVCGEEFYIQRDSSMTFICPKCAKAVLKMRSMMTEEELNG